MEPIQLSDVKYVSDLRDRAEHAGEPLILLDGWVECLVALSPAALERLLFETDQINVAGRCPAFIE